MVEIAWLLPVSSAFKDDVGLSSGLLLREFPPCTESPLSLKYFSYLYTSEDSTLYSLSSRKLSKR